MMPLATQRKFSWRPRRLAFIGCALCGLAVPWPAAPAASPPPDDLDRYVVEHEGLRLEVTAPRDDIVRVRIGHPDLPEEASWAVAADVRNARRPMRIGHGGNKVMLRTKSVEVDVDTDTLQITIRDAGGRILMQDVDAGATFARGGFGLAKVMPEGVRYFALGDKTGPLDRRGGAFTLWNTDAFGFSAATDPLYKSVPFFLGVDEQGGSVGFFLDNTWRTTFDFGKRDPDRLLIDAAGGPVDYYVMAGPDPKEVVMQYAWLTGTAPLTPLWALGFQQSHWGYLTEQMARSVADRLRQDRIPADAVYLDIDYQDRNRPFSVDTKSFPDLQKFVAHLRAEDLHLVLITDLHVAEVAGQDYLPYDSGKAADVFLKTPAGSDYVGTVWPGDAVFPDFSRAPVREWWGAQYAGFVKLGVSGFWNDMNEPSIFEVRSKTMPLDTVHRIDEPGFAPRTASHAEMHNVYGMLNTRATYDGLLKLAPDRRPFVLTRASYAGGQRYAATWTGDNKSSWEQLHLSISMLVNLGLSGFAYAGDDIGGFSGQPPSAELLTRWIEIGAFNPIFRDHYDKKKRAQEVWVDGPEHEAIRRRFIEERYRLMPYIYAVAEENSRTGLPILRPVFLEYPATLGKEWESDGEPEQFMLGGDLLIAPPVVWESPAPYTIKLPSDGWFDYWTGRRLDAAETTETPRLDHLPVFVRPGSILVKQPLVQSTTETPRGPLVLDVYPGDKCGGHVYLDDGISFAYQRGEYLRQDFTCRQDGSVLDIDFAPRAGAYKPWWTQMTLVVHGWSRARPGASVAGKPVPVDYEASSNTLTMTLPDQPGAARIRIK